MGQHGIKKMSLFEGDEVCIWSDKIVVEVKGTFDIGEAVKKDEILTKSTQVPITIIKTVTFQWEK